MKPFADDEVYVGRMAGGRSLIVDPVMVGKYVAATGDANPWYSGNSPLGYPIAPALLLHSEFFVDKSWYLNHFGALHAKLEWDAYRPVKVGERVTTRCTIVDRYVKRGRDYVVNEALTFDDGGALLSRSRAHHSFLIEADPSVMVADPQTDRREYAVNTDGELFEGPPRLITPAMCMAFSGPAKNYHTDAEAARKVGFPNILVQGMQTVCLMAETMTRRFGLGFYLGGRLALNMVNILWAGETARTRGRIVERRPEGHHTRVLCELWCEVVDGPRVVLGSASALEF